MGSFEPLNLVLHTQVGGSDGVTNRTTLYWHRGQTHSCFICFPFMCQSLIVPMVRTEGAWSGLALNHAVL